MRIINDQIIINLDELPDVKLEKDLLDYVHKPPHNPSYYVSLYGHVAENTFDVSRETILKAFEFATLKGLAKIIKLGGLNHE